MGVKKPALMAGFIFTSEIGRVLLIDFTLFKRIGFQVNLIAGQLCVKLIHLAPFQAGDMRFRCLVIDRFGGIMTTDWVPENGDRPQQKVHDAIAIGSTVEGSATGQ